jgi:RNA polymerase sigma factor (sigma-70 family)
MLLRSLRTVLHKVRPQLRPAPTGVGDAELLARFLNQHDEAAFELLVWRHGPLVLGVCRRVLGNAHDAEDAFQATFFILARKAGSIGRGHSVASWLYKVAYRVALRARARRAKLDRCVRPLGEQAVPAADGEPAALLAGKDLRPLLDAAISRLPEKYRDPVVLCYFEGKTNEEAARQLGCPKGTILSRLARARERLRRSLGRHGLGLAALPFAMLLADHARALVEVSPVLVNAAVQLAILLPIARAAAGLSSGAVELAEEVLRDMARARLLLAAGVLGLATLVAGAGGYAAGVFDAGPTTPELTRPAKATGCRRNSM